MVDEIRRDIKYPIESNNYQRNPDWKDPMDDHELADLLVKRGFIHSPDVDVHELAKSITRRKKLLKGENPDVEENEENKEDDADQGVSRHEPSI